MKFCKHCQKETERYKSGVCKPCSIKSASEWNKKNKEKRKEICKKYRDANLIDVRIRVSKWGKLNRDKRNSYAKNWYINHIDKSREKCRNRRALILNARGSHTNEDIQTIMSLQKYKCACCKKNIKDKYHIDHIIPLSKGGSNDKLNLQLLCKTCNLKKGKQNPTDFMQSIGFLI